jgi:hypothetical protein
MTTFWSATAFKISPGATLIEKHERQKKEKKGLHGEERGTDAAAIDALGAAMRSVGLVAFAGIGGWLIPKYQCHWLSAARLSPGCWSTFHLDRSTTASAVIAISEQGRLVMDILTATKDFEKWVGRRTHVVKSQFSDKHKQMAENPVQFLRGTFYGWTQLFPEICSGATQSTGSPVGWRFAHSELRLAVSAILDASEGQIKVGLANVVDVILDDYRTCLSEGGKPFVLEENHKWLRNIALGCLDIPANFWKKMDALPSTRTNVLEGM